MEGVETIEEACKRECREETGLTPEQLSTNGIRYLIASSNLFRMHRISF